MGILTDNLKGVRSAHRGEVADRVAVTAQPTARGNAGRNIAEPRAAPQLRSTPASGRSFARGSFRCRVQNEQRAPTETRYDKPLESEGVLMEI